MIQLEGLMKMLKVNNLDVSIAAVVLDVFGNIFKVWKKILIAVTCDGHLSLLTAVKTIWHVEKKWRPSKV